MKVTKRAVLHANVDFTPMIDVVFQLILFFLVSTTFSVLPGISVNLPQSSTSQSTAADGITITATVDGKMYVNEIPVTFKTIDSVLAGVDTGERKREEFPVTLEADDKVTNGTIVEVFDALRRNGFSAVSLRTNNK
ncbi:MAG: biopolymer transporter ExbD [Treponema sp.]